MNREIKFRAWYKNKMYNVKGFNNVTIYTDCWDGGSGYVNIPRQESELAKIVPSILLQYTGLKDKKWVEIYNKDIIRDGGRLWIVEISNLYGVVLRLLKDKKITRPYVKFEKHLIDDFEVIGNIYENPELVN